MAYTHPFIVDVHAHATSDDIVKEFGCPGFPIREEHLVALGIKTCILSPAIFSYMTDKWPSEKYTQFCRKQTNWQAQLVREEPLAWGSFAPLPLQSVEDTLAALAYCTTKLNPKSDGYALPTSAQGRYLGNSFYAPILEELNRLEVVLFVHPSETVMPNLDQEKFSFAVLEYPQETARLLTEMIDEGIFVKYPNIHWIFAHNGGTFPFIFQRVIRNLTPQNLIGYGGLKAMHSQYNRIKATNNGKSLQDIFSTSNIYLEGAQGTASQHFVLRSVGMTASKLLSGSDLPFTAHESGDLSALRQELRAAEDSGLYNAEEVKNVYSGNALRLFPRINAEWDRS